MSFSDRPSSVRGDNPGALRQEQREALLDALHFCMYADNRLVLAEDKVVADLIAGMPWESDIAVADYVAASISSVRRSKDEPGFRADFVADIGARLADDAARAVALRWCQKIVSADGVSAESEKLALAELKLEARLG